MAENELLDLGNRKRWRLTLAAATNPNSSLNDLLICAASDFDRDVRDLADVLRKGDPLLILLRQCEESYVEQQAVIANYKEKKLLRTVLRARKEAGSDVPAEIARIAARILINAIVDQIALQRSKHEQHRSHEARHELRAALLREFLSSQRAIETALEASLTGKPVNRFKSNRIVRTPKMDAKAVALMPLASKQKVPAHAPR
jgi:hypothetical protein